MKLIVFHLFYNLSILQVSMVLLDYIRSLMGWTSVSTAAFLASHHEYRHFLRCLLTFGLTFFQTYDYLLTFPDEVSAWCQLSQTQTRI